MKRVKEILSVLLHSMLLTSKAELQVNKIQITHWSLSKRADANIDSITAFQKDKKNLFFFKCGHFCLNLLKMYQKKNITQPNDKYIHIITKPIEKN